MAYEIPVNPQRKAEVETAHDDLATEHGRDNVLVTEADGNIVSIVGDGVGTIDPVSVDVDGGGRVTTMSNATDAGAEEAQQDNDSQKVAVPEEWEHVKPELIPLFEATAEWFEYIYEQFYFSTGGVGQATRLTPNGVEFSRFHRVHGDDERQFYEEVVDRYENNETIEDALVVGDLEAAIEAGEQATWVTYDARDEFWVSEYVPFEDEVTTADGLADELSEIMVNHPDFEELFEETSTVVNELFDLDGAE